MDSIPREVLRAMDTDFDVPITGYLMFAVKHDPVVSGTVYGDARQRFEDGASIQTSVIVQTALHQGYVLLRTLAGSCYVVVSWQASGDNVHVNRTVH